MPAGRLLLMAAAFRIKGAAASEFAYEQARAGPAADERFALPAVAELTMPMATFREFRPSARCAHPAGRRSAQPRSCTFEPWSTALRFAATAGCSTRLLTNMTATVRLTRMRWSTAPAR